MQRSSIERTTLEKLVRHKLLRKATMAENQLARRTARQKAREERDQRKSERENAFYLSRQQKNILQRAQVVRREDWELGPLAPKRDVGDQKDTYGAIDGQLVRGAKLSKEEAEEKMKDFGGKFLSLVKGDRVVLLEGRDKGKIGKVLSVDRERAECTVEGLNLVRNTKFLLHSQYKKIMLIAMLQIDVKIPQWMQDAEPTDKRPVRTIEKGISIASVRLVYPLIDRETGTTRDVIVKKLVNGPIFHDKQFGTTRWARIIPGLNIKIPWPKKEPQNYQDNDCDTFRLDVDVKNFVPTLLNPPMPPSVIDELRNKYSKFRTRHEPEYIEKKIQEEEQKMILQKKASLMRTPLKEANRLQRKLRKAKGKGKFTTYMAERIGEFIAKKRELATHLAEDKKTSVAETTST